MSPKAILALGSAAALTLGVAVILYWSGGGERPYRSDGASRDPAAATYVGGRTCTECHQQEHARWAGSHHDLAMQRANEQTVLGDFNHATFEHFGVTSTFYEKDKRFFVRTDGPDGHLHDYKITYTFGATPLQQYLIEFPDGRYQALGIAWDDRPRAEGGQRWFHLHPDEKIEHVDALHWTGRNQTWNDMCAECHSTNLNKRYDLQHDRYDTTWTDIDVSCEACHGPGSRHVKWARDDGDGGSPERQTGAGLLVRFDQPTGNAWKRAPGTDTAKRATPLASQAELETCAHCHSRRRVIHDTDIPGRPLLNTHQVALLEPRLYHPDGQIMGEVYVYGSFLQSKMHRAGVTCSDCHDPHSLQLRAVGNSLCTRCHAPAKFDSPQHHFHKTSSEGAQCVACHMPATTYMVVDPRRDHSFRIPRPGLSKKLNTPNACTQCHTIRSAQWAVEAVAQWYGAEKVKRPHYGEPIYRGREGLPGADADLETLIVESEVPGIVRATALTLLRPYAGRATLEAIKQGLQDKDPLVRIGATRAVGMITPAERVGLLQHLLDDPIRSVRVEAARLLAPVPPDRLTEGQRTALARATQEYVAAELVNGERPSAHLNLGVFYVDQGKPSKVEEAYRTALRLEPSFYPALVNLADLYRMQGRDQEGEALLRRALALAPNDANVHHSFGLLLVRMKRQDEALEAFRRAVALQPDNPRHGYVYGIALNAAGKAGEAIKVLERVHRRSPTHREALVALATINRDRGQRAAAIRYAEKLVALSPEDTTARRLVEELRRGGN